MNYIHLSTDSEIIFKADTRSDNTPAKAINEAIEFVKEHGLNSVDLNINGFTIYIDEESDLRELVSEYVHWRSIQTAP